MSLSRVLESLGVEFQMYADDTQVYFEFEEADIVNTKLRLCNILDRIVSWMSSRRLKLNISKTKLMIFSPKNKREKILSDFGDFSYMNINLSPSREVKNLGVIFDSELSFNKQINNVIRICNFCIFNLKSIKKFIPKHLIIKVVHSEILSRLDYCNSLYLQLPKYQLKRLQNIINKSVRLIYSLSYHDHVTVYLKNELHWLTIGPRIDFKIILITHKVLLSQYPEYLKNLLEYPPNRSDLPSRNQNLMQRRIPGNHKFAEPSFYYSAPRIYNKVPTAIKINSTTIESFKK